MRGLMNLGVAIALLAPSLGQADTNISPATATNGPVVLAAEQSCGGNILRTAQRALIGVTLDRSCATNFKVTADACITWKLVEPLAEGWWHGTVESNFRGGYANRDFSIMLLSDRKPAVAVAPNYVAAKPGEAQRFDFWIYCSAPVLSVRIQPMGDLWYWNNTWPVSAIRLEHRTPGELSALDAITVDLPAQTNGMIALPQTLPPGNWTLAGVTRKPGAAVVTGGDGRSIALPFGLDRYKTVTTRTACFYMDAPLAGVSYQPRDLFKAVELRHNVTRVMTNSLGPDVPLIVTVDTGRTESATLVLTGSGLTGAAPVLPLLPQGKQIAVLTSWDDGAPTDLRCAEILTRHGYRPSFFLNQGTAAMQALDKLEAMNVEIGSHCFHHPSLYALPPRNALEECVGMRKVLEQALHHPVISFGYPNGYSPAYDVDGDYVLRAVQAAGYWSCRTTWAAQERVATSTNLLVMRTDGFFGNARDLERVWATVHTNAGSIFYFWGHSWQIGKTDADWQKFETFVTQFAGQTNAWYASQGELALWLWARQSVQFTIADKSPKKTVVMLSRPWLHPYLAARCPVSVRLPPGVTGAAWEGRDVAISNGVVELTWPSAEALNGARQP